MGLYDESWCVDCGKSQPYSPDDVVCGSCTSEAYESRSNQLIEYMKLHLISLMQDLEALEDEMEKLDMNSKAYVELDFEYNIKSGEITATRHLMSVASDILGVQTEEN
jgi:hypothetical protein